MRRILCVATLLALSLFGAQARADREVTKREFAQQVYSSVVLLYGQTPDGGMQMLCTATAYKDVKRDGKDKTRFVSAAHCVSGDTDEEQKRQKYFISADSFGTKTFISATLVEAGDKKKGDDFSIFEVDGTQFPVVTLGDSSKVSIAEPVLDVSAPLGLGKLYFEGYVSNTKMDRPPINAGEVQWTDVMIVSIGGGPGSSGSAVVSLEQRAVVGFLVGEFGSGASAVGFIVMPVNKFKAFEASVDAGTYKKTPSKRAEAESFFGLKKMEGRQ